MKNFELKTFRQFNEGVNNFISTVDNIDELIPLSSNNLHPTEEDKQEMNEVFSILMMKDTESTEFESLFDEIDGEYNFCKNSLKQIDYNNEDETQDSVYVTLIGIKKDRNLNYDEVLQSTIVSKDFNDFISKVDDSYYKITLSVTCHQDYEQKLDRKNSYIVLGLVKQDGRMYFSDKDYTKEEIEQLKNWTFDIIEGIFLNDSELK